MAGQTYLRLTPRRRTPAGSSELWIATDHLLLVNRHWWIERYQRFRLKDIQAVVVSERPSRFLLQMTGLAISAMFWLAAVYVPDSIAGKIFFGVILSVLLIWQMVDLLRGPYCEVRLITAVSSLRLPAISRMRVAERFLGRALPLIQQAQQELASAPPPLPASSSVIALDASASVAPAIHEFGLTQPPPLPKPKRPAIELALFAVTVLFGAVSLAALTFEYKQWLWSLSLTLWMGPIVLAGLVALGPAAVSDASRPLAWIIGLTTIAGSLFAIAAWYDIALASEGSRFDSPKVLSQFTEWRILWGVAVALIAMGIAGLLNLVVRRAPASDSQVS
jgi:hypothetical protein